jgi:RND family efflux transporter MFP subunit
MFGGFMKSRQRRIIIGSLILSLIIALGYWRHASAAKSLSVRGAETGDASARSMQAQLFEVRKDRMTDTIDGLVGTIKGNTIELTFNGQEERMIAARARIGQRVRKGDILFELDHIRSQSRKSQAQANAERAKELQSVGGATQRDVDEAQASLNMAQKDFDDTFIYAPEDGFVSQINRQPGETITRNEIVAVLVGTHDRLAMETGVIEGQLDQVNAGQKVLVNVEALGPTPITGIVQGVSREVTTTGRTGTVIVALPGEVQGKLRPGMSARCKIFVYDQSTLEIPRTAYDADKKGLFVVGDDRKAHFVSVTLGHVTRESYEVTDGLHEGDRIVSDLIANPVDEKMEIVASGEMLHAHTPAPAQ